MVCQEKNQSAAIVPLDDQQMEEITAAGLRCWFAAANELVLQLGISFREALVLTTEFLFIPDSQCPF